MVRPCRDLRPGRLRRRRLQRAEREAVLPRGRQDTQRENQLRSCSLGVRRPASHEKAAHAGRCGPGGWLSSNRAVLTCYTMSEQRRGYSHGPYRHVRVVQSDRPPMRRALRTARSCATTTACGRDDSGRSSCRRFAPRLPASAPLDCRPVFDLRLCARVTRIKGDGRRVVEADVCNRRPSP